MQGDEAELDGSKTELDPDTAVEPEPEGGRPAVEPVKTTRSRTPAAEEIAVQQMDPMAR